MKTKYKLSLPKSPRWKGSMKQGARELKNKKTPQKQKKHTSATTGTNNIQPLLTRQSDALTSPQSSQFFHLLLFLFILGARHISLWVRGGCDCLEMKSQWAMHDWNPCINAGSCLCQLLLLTRKHDVKTGASEDSKEQLKISKLVLLNWTRGTHVLQHGTKYIDQKLVCLRLMNSC